MKLVDLGEPTSFLNHVYQGCAQRECKPNENIEEYRKIADHAFLREQILGGKIFEAKTVAWSYGRKGHKKKCVERFCELANQQTEQLYKVSTPCLDDHLG